MHFKKILACLALVLAKGFFGCAKEKTAEAPKQESVTKNLVPPKAEVKAPSFLVELSELQTATMVTRPPRKSSRRRALRVAAR